MPCDVVSLLDIGRCWQNKVKYLGKERKKLNCIITILECSEAFREKMPENTTY